MDVSEEILLNHLIYGASDYTNPRTLSASKSLNFAKGASIQNPIRQKVTVLPFIYTYQDSVGLFGTENCFVRVDLKIDTSVALICIDEEYWECALITNVDDTGDPYYQQAVIDFTADRDTVNDYEPANLIANSLPKGIYDAYASVDLENLKTGNKYTDDWLDVRLYTKTRQPIGSNHTYVKYNDFFYIGFHARNTRELPYNVKVTIGREIRSGLPSTDCYDDWAVLPPNGCVCVEEPGWLCGEMTLFNETYAGWQQAGVDSTKDPSTVNTYESARTTLQGTECISDPLSDLLGLPRGGIQEIPPPKKARKSEPCCSTCH